MTSSSFVSQLNSAIQKTPGNIAGGAVDLTNLALGLLTGKGLAGFSPKPVGGSDFINQDVLKIAGSNKTSTQSTIESLLSMFNPSSAVKGGAIAAGALGTRLALGASSAKTVKELKAQFGPGFKQAGIIVPVGAVSPAFRATTKIHTQPLSGQRVATVPDSAQKMDKDLLKPAGTGKDSQQLALPIDGLTAADFLSSHANYPADLLSYLSNVTVHPGTGTRTSGSFSARDDRIILSPGTPKELMSTLLHEIQHSAQYRYGMPNGGSMSEFFQNYGKFSTADELVKQRLKELKLNSAGADLPMASFPLTDREELFKSPETLQFVNKYLYDTKKQAYNNYQLLGGEAEARLVQNMFENNNYTDPAITIMQRDMTNADPELLIPRSDIKKNLVDTEPALQGILDLVLGVKP